MNWRGVGNFLALAFAPAWGVELLVIARGGRFDTPTSTQVALLAAVMWAPAAAAVVVRRWITREGFSSAGLRIGPRRYYLAAWLGIPALVTLMYAVTLLLDLGALDPTLSRAVPPSGASGAATLPPPPVMAGTLVAASLTVGVVLTTIATFGEEFGWTGYLLPALLPLGRWRAAALYGIAWGVWHAPIIAAGYNYPGHPFAGVLAMCGFTTGLALIQTAARLRSDSVILTSVVHAGINAQGRGLWPVLVVDVPPLLGGLTGVVGIAVLAMAGAILLARTPEAR